MSDAKILVGVGVVVIAAYVVGWLAARVGQPRVIGEVLAGVALGPTVLGQLPGDPSSALFPLETRPALVAFGTLGVVLYVFVVGLRFTLPSGARSDVAIVSVATSSFVVPFGLGIGLASILWSAGEHGGDFLPFALFVGTALAVTALPVLARLIDECDLTGSTSAEVAMASAILQEPLIWLALAASLLSAEASGTAEVIGAALGLAAMAIAATALLRWPPEWANAAAARASAAVVPAIGVVCLAAAATAALRVHPLIGALSTGIVLRRLGGDTTARLRAAVEPLTRAVLLPLFLVLPGLSIDLTSLPADHLWLMLLGIAAASIGKGATAWAAAAAAGLDGREALTVGALMNTRGLVELLVLNVGHANGILDDEAFATLLVMALVTTAATSPLISVIGRTDTRTAA